MGNHGGQRTACSAISRKYRIPACSDPVLKEFRFLVPVSEMKKDPLLAPFLEDGTVRIIELISDDRGIDLYETCSGAYGWARRRSQ